MLKHSNIPKKYICVLCLLIYMSFIVRNDSNRSLKIKHLWAYQSSVCQLYLWIVFWPVSSMACSLYYILLIITKIGFPFPPEYSVDYTSWAFCGYVEPCVQFWPLGYEWKQHLLFLEWGRKSFFPSTWQQSNFKCLR